MDDLIGEFIEETSESLSILDSELVKFEQNPHDETILGNIFRLVHTIKGTCGFLGLPRLEAVAHAGENILGKIRDKSMDVSPAAISLVLESLDCIKELVEHLAENGSEPEGDDSDLINRLNAFVESGGEAVEAATPAAPEVVEEAAPVAEEAIGKVERYEHKPEELPEEDVEAIKKLAEGLPASFDGDDEALQRIFDETPGPDLSAPAAVEESKEPEKAEEPPATPPAKVEADIADEPEEKAAAPVSNIPEETKKQAIDRGLEAAEKAVPDKKAAPMANQSIRVNLDVLESLMQMVGELVLTRNQLLQMTRQVESKEFTAPIQQLSLITTELQEQVMKTRMQPIGNAWAKFPRLIRDLAMELDKKIELRMVGAETELDRQLLEMIKDPLTHMVRNSADHGLESSEKRRAAGKPETGTITLSAYHEGGHIIIEISDDGGGINVDRVKQKAIENGLATADDMAAMSENQIIQYIFKPGFSTAEKVTSVSGRGVGMDVVRTNIEKIGGAIELTSELGKGSVFHIKIPLTLAIVSVLVVKAQEERFAIPQINVLELVKSTRDSHHRIEEINGSAVLRLREKLLPLISLSEVLQLEEKRDHSKADTSYIVVCKVGGSEFGLIVDQIFDTEEIVVKPKSDLLKDIDLYSGTTILGDGSVIMILDPNGLSRCVGDVEKGKEESALMVAEAQNKDMVRFLLFTAGDKGQKAIPLELVARLEELDMETVEHSSGRPVVQYRGALMRLIALDGSVVPTEGTKEVMVFQYDGRIMGVVVDEILDIVEAPYSLKMASDNPGLMGSMVLRDRTTDIVDIGHHITELFSTAVQGKEMRMRQRLLFVEDSPFFRKMTVPFLERAGFEVIPMEHGELAYHYLQDHNNIDIVVTDIEMPHMDGFELIAHIKRMEKWANLPVFGFTSTVNDKFLQTARKAGFVDFIEKTNRAALIDAIEGFVSRQLESA